MDWFTIKKVIYISLIGVIIFVFSYFSKDLGICSPGATYCGDYNEYITIYSIYSFVILYSSILYYFTTQQYKNHILRVAKVTLLVCLFLTIITPRKTEVFDLIPEKGVLTLWLIVVYFALITIYFVYKSLKK